MDGVKPGGRSMCPKPQHAGRRTGQQPWTGEAQGSLRRAGGRGKVFLVAEALGRWQARRGDKRPALCTPACQGHVGQSTSAPRLWPLPNGEDRQHQHGSVGLVGNTQATKSVKGTAERLSTGGTAAVPLPLQNACLGSCSQGCKNKRCEKRRRPRKEQATATACDYHKQLI